MDAIRRSAVHVFSIVAMTLLTAQPAHALVFGGRREPQKHDIWPAGAFRLINFESRVAWCVGPSLRMPNHFEYQGDAAALNAALKLLVAVEGPRPHVVVSDGRASSRWIEPGKDGLPTFVDWTFDICQKETLDGAKPAAPPKPVVSSPWSQEKSPAPEFRIYLGNGLDWSKVVIPEGLDVTDERLVANGFRPEDSSVVDLVVEDSQTAARLAGAELLIERWTNVTPANAADREVTRAESNSEGRILLRMLPREPVKLTLSKAGFATRSLGIVNLQQTSLIKRTVQLSPAHRVSGRVIDDNGTAVMNARVALLPVVGDDGAIYEQPERASLETGADGGFVFEGVPAGSMWIGATSRDHVSSGYREPRRVSDAPVELRLSSGGRLQVNVPELGGSSKWLVTAWSEGPEESARSKRSVWCQPGSSVQLTQLAPGRYTIKSRIDGQPHETSERVTVEVHPRSVENVHLKPRERK